MIDEIRQIQEEKFNTVVLGLVLFGLAASLVTLLVRGPTSIWLFRSLAVLVIALVTFGIRQFSQLAAAAYVLVGALVIWVASIAWLPGSITSFAPYFFVPVILIAGQLLNPLATLGTTTASIFVTLLVYWLNGQLPSTQAGPVLLPPFALALVTGLLAASNGRYMQRLGDCLVEGRLLLRARTLEMLAGMRQNDRLHQRISSLEQQIAEARSETSQARQAAVQRAGGVAQLLDGALLELRRATRQAQEVLEKAGEQSGPAEPGRGLAEVWPKIYHLNSLVVNLEELAQLENGRVELHYEPVDIPRLIAELAGTVRGLVRSKDIAVHTWTPEDLPPVPADPTRLRQALLHVLNNAIKYTDQGTIEIQAEVTDGELLLFVADTGIGMHREEMDLIFEQFGRGSGTLARQRQGAGLGLAISKGLIERHDGRMWVTSVLGVGSTFYMALPMARPALDRTMVSQAVPARVAASTNSQGGLGQVESAFAATAETREHRLEAQQEFYPVPGTSVGPVARFSQAYISRFAVILVGLLLLVAGVVMVLALFNPAPSTAMKTPAAGPSPATSAAQASVTRPAGASPTASPAAAGLVPTATPAFKAAPSPAAVSTLPPTPSPATPTPLLVMPALIPTAASPLPATPTLPVITQAPPATPTAAVPPQARVGQTATASPVAAPPSPTLSAGPAPSPVEPQVALAGGLGIQAVDLGQGLKAGLPAQGGDLDAAQNKLAWSPDGGRVLFAASPEGQLDLYLAEAACIGGGTCPDKPLNLTAAAGDDTQPAWSPDGRWIAFSSGRGGNFDLYALEAGCTSQPAGCATGPVQLTHSLGFDEWPAWSPDGRQLAFVSDESGDVEIYTLPVACLDSSSGCASLIPTRITTSPGEDWPVTWSPDGRWLLFASTRDGNWNLYLAEAACPSLPGGCPNRTFRLTADPADERDPTWSPDGRQIAFAANGAGNWDIYTLPASTDPTIEVPRSQWIQVTTTPGDERWPGWVK